MRLLEHKTDPPRSAIGIQTWYQLRTIIDLRHARNIERRPVYGNQFVYIQFLLLDQIDLGK